MKEFEKIDWTKLPPIEECTDMGDKNRFGEEICVIAIENGEVKTQSIDKFDKI